MRNLINNTLRLEEYDDELPPIKKKLGMSMKIGIVIFAIANCIDLITTEIGLHANPNQFFEANPLGALIVPHLWLAIVCKIFVIGMVSFLVSLLALRNRERPALAALYFMCGYYTFVCISNTVQLKILLGT